MNTFTLISNMVIVILSGLIFYNIYSSTGAVNLGLVIILVLAVANMIVAKK